MADGAMGTYYQSLYPDDENIVEMAVLDNPDRIKNIHKSYIDAGAVLIRTDSFACVGPFIESDELKAEIASKSYELAREAAKESGRDVIVAADIGTLFDPAMEGHILSDIKPVLDAFLAAGADVFDFETQTQTEGLSEIFSYIKEKNPKAQIIVTFSVNKNGMTTGGLSADNIMQFGASEENIDAFGFNCGVGASHMADIIKKVSFYTDKPFMVLPNAGYPYNLRGRQIFSGDSSFFTEKMKDIVSSGADIIGGCCGTTPEFIKKLGETFSGKKSGERKIVEAFDKKTRTFSSFYKKLVNDEKPIVVELDPPFGSDITKVMNSARTLSKADVDIITLSDSPMGRSRMDPMLLGAMMQKETGTDVMPHVACRDRNLIGLRGCLLGSYAAGLRHFLMITGDPVPAADRSQVTSVFDYNSIRFMNMAKLLNEDDFSADRIVYGGALNYHGRNAEAIARRMKLKMEQGCSFFLTQPVYGDDDIERLSLLKKMTGAKIIAGIMPLVSYKNATFMANEMPGIHVPESIVNLYSPDMSREEAEKVAVSVSLDIADKMREMTDGYYFMVPFNRVKLICDIIKQIRK
ncbi:MAG: bifunctional homocysteine S-methyltransferase/methylenetetrahydrofolate reductase [Lachnospiraceae bacterium]|nr:MAG: bifunctional homocysteine S-methyltransferase/methylenetetrahydrofolate reductase [Lachnospiraceae bacterium]